MKRSSRSIGFAMLAVVCATADGRAAAQEKQRPLVGLAGEVRAGTSDYRDVRAALADGYESTGSCVSGPERGAMGVHFANGTLVGDGLLDPRRPELLIYEARGGRMRLVGVEFLVLADAWHAHTEASPVLMGQQFHLVGSPNRYGLPAFYELHVWAWRDNPNGMFVDWNPAVSCDEYVPDGAAGGASHH